MASNFQTANNKHSRNRYDQNNPAFNPTVNPKGQIESDNFSRNLHKYRDFVSWARFFPDLFFDLITPPTGGIKLDLDQRVFLRSTARFLSTYGVFPRGYGKCVAGDTLLFTEDGIKEIGEFFNYVNHNKEIYTSHELSLLNRDGKLERTRGGIYSGYKETKVIETEEGFQIESSLNHPLLVIDQNGNHVWKKSEDISEGDYVVISRKNDVWGNPTNLDIDIEQHIKTLNKDKEVPKDILRAPKKVVAEFIKTLFESNGIVSLEHVEYSTASEKLSKQIQILLLNFGIISSRVKKANKVTGSFKFIIKVHHDDLNLYHNEIGFSCGKKQGQLKDTSQNNILLLDQLRKSNYFYSKVKSVNDSQNHVYDFHLPKTNSFVSNGLISHNTYLEFLSMVHTAIFYPDIEVSMTAQTKENAANLIDEKWREVEKHFPMLKKEVVNYQKSKDSARLLFTSGGSIDTLANQQSTKGARRKRLNIEEAALLNNDLFQDVLEPIVNVPRRTIGKEAVVNPEELNGQINFFTTSWFRGTDEFERNLRMVDDMANLTGSMVLGADWQLAVNYGRGEPKSKILDKKEKLSKVFFDMNYGSLWVGSVDGGLVDINKVMKLRTLPKPDTTPERGYTYITIMDVARSTSDANNKSSIVLLKFKKTKRGTVNSVKVANIISLPNGLNFTAQTVYLKRITNHFKASAAVVDTNGLGAGIKDECLKDTIDPDTGQSLGCWDTINTDDEPDEADAEKLLYALTSQGKNHNIILTFMDFIESEKLQLLDKKSHADYDAEDNEEYETLILPHLQTDRLLEEIANLKLKKNQNGTYSVEQVTKKIDKDRYSALSMGLWYIKEFEDKVEKEEKKIDPNKLFLIRKPQLRKF